MRKRLFLFLVVCLAFLITAYDASATERQPKTTAKSVTSTEAAQSQPTDVSQKAATKASDKSGTVGNTKKSSKKQKAQVSAKSKSKASNSREYKKDRRNPASLPVVKEDFTETPQSVLAALSAIPVDGEISSLFGMRRLVKISKRPQMHTGIDINAPRGTHVFAAAPGVISFVGRWGAYGITVEIDHGNGLVTRYAHLDKYIAEQGAKVVAGEQIGHVGKTGNALNMHLHFETLVNGRKVDPMLADMWHQTRTTKATKGDIVVSGLRSDSNPVH